MTLIRSGARDRISSRTRAGLAAVRLGAGVAIIATRAISFRRIRALSCARVARASFMTLIRRGAGDRIRSGAGARLAAVHLGACVAIIACTPIGLGGIRALPRARIARAGFMTLIRSGAGHRIRSGAGAGLARVRLRTGVTIIATRSIGLRWVRALTRARTARARFMTLVRCGTGYWVCSRACAGLARVRLRA